MNDLIKRIILESPLFLGALSFFIAFIYYGQKEAIVMLTKQKNEIPLRITPT